MFNTEQCRLRVVVVLGFSLALWILIVPIKTTRFTVYDEGFAVLNAARILAGDTPYKDFWATYPPGQFYTLAFLFKIFGVNLLVSRIYDTGVRFVVAVGVYFVTKTITSPLTALLACLITAFLLSAVGFYAYAVIPALGLGLFSVFGSIKHIETQSRYWLFISGALMGIAAFFRWDIALYFAISVTLTMIVSCVHGPWKKLDCLSDKSLRCVGGRVLAVLASTLVVVLLFYGPVIRNSGIGNLWRQVIIFPVNELHSFRWKPYPGLIPIFLVLPETTSALKGTYFEFLNWLRFYFPLATYTVAFFYVGKLFVSKRSALPPYFWGILVSTLLGLLLFAQALSRYDFIHVMPTLIIALILLISLAYQSVLNSSSGFVRLFIVMGLLGYLMFFFASPIKNFLSFVYRPSTILHCYSLTQRASCIYIDEHQEQAVEYVRSHTEANEVIFVGNTRHDLIFINDVGFYFLADRPSATFYHELFPGVATTLQVQKQIVNDIISKNVNWIVLVNMPISQEPNASALSSDVHYLDDFIRSNTVPVIVFGDYAVLKRFSANE